MWCRKTPGWRAEGKGALGDIRKVSDGQLTNRSAIQRLFPSHGTHYKSQTGILSVTTMGVKAERYPSRSHIREQLWNQGGWKLARAETPRKDLELHVESVKCH